MATISTRINSSGTYFVNGTFDEVTYNRTSPVIKNLLTSTEEINLWGTYLNLVTADQSIAPNTTLTAERIQVDPGGYTAIVNIPTVVGAVYTFSLWVKSYTGSSGTWGVNWYSNSSGHHRTTVPITGDWARQSITFTADNLQTNVYVADNRSALASITDGYVWGAQFEIAANATIYQGITSSGTLITPTFKNKVTSDAVYVTDIFDEVTFNPTTSGLYIGNSLSYSQDMSQTSVWSYSSGGSGVPPVVTPNAALAPDGTLTANRVFFNSGPVTGTGQSSLNQGNAVPLTTGTSQTFSVWMRVETTATSVNMFNGDAINSLAIDTNWTRYSLPITYSSPVAYGVRIAKREIWGTGGAANVLIWGAQMNPGLTATIHVPTGANATPISVAAKKETNEGALYVTSNFNEVGGMIATNGLILQLDPGKVESFRSTSTSFIDISGNTRNCRFTGAITYNSTTSSLLFDTPTVTTNNNISLISLDGIDNTIFFTDGSEYTIEFWCKIASDAIQTYHSIAGRNSTNPWLGIEKQATNFRLFFRQIGGTYFYSTDINTLVFTGWTQVVFSVNANRVVNYYVNHTNGTFADADTLTTSTFTINRLGAGYSSGGNFYAFDGDVGPINIYNRALSLEEVNNNFEALRDRFGI
jgi:hypothetical protein